MSCPRGPISCNSEASVGDQSSNELTNHKVPTLDGNNSDTTTVENVLSSEASRQSGGDGHAYQTRASMLFSLQW